MATIGELRYVSHCVYGVGAILAERIIDSGAAVCVWFVDCGTVRTILAESLTEAPRPELSKEQARALRHAVAEYRREHKIKRVRKTADRPRKQRPFNDRPAWRQTSSFAGREDELAPVDEEVSAAEYSPQFR